VIQAGARWSYRISVADAWIAATAKIHHLHLIHKDPQFEPLKEELPLTELPYKEKLRGPKNFSHKGDAAQTPA
jgi:hypothetical protein